MVLTIDTIDLIYYIYFTLMGVGFTYIVICELLNCVESKKDIIKTIKGVL